MSSINTGTGGSPHPAGPQVAGANGVIQLTDPAPPAPRFYRAAEL